MQKNTLLDISAMEVAAEVAEVVVAVGIRRNKTGVSETAVKAQLRVRWFIQVQVGDKWFTSCKKTFLKNTKSMITTQRNCRATQVGIAWSLLTSTVMFLTYELKAIGLQGKGGVRTRSNTRDPTHKNQTNHSRSHRSGRYLSDFFLLAISLQMVPGTKQMVPVRGTFSLLNLRDGGSC